MKYSFLFVICALFLWMGCDDEDDIKVSEGLEISYTLPQGDHEYDDDIVAWYDKYGFYTLYIYEPKDIYWANTNWEERFEQENGRSGGKLSAKMAEEEYVGDQLKVFEQFFLDVYPDSLLTHYMPLKVLSCAELWSTRVKAGYDYELGEMVRTVVYDTIWAYEGWDYIAMNGAGLKMNVKDAASQMRLSYEVNTIFLKKLYKAGKFKMTEEFASVSDYSGTDYLVGPVGCLPRGFLADNPLGGGAVEANQERDFEEYLNIVAMPLKMLEGTPDTRFDGGYYPDNYEPTKWSVVGVLNATRDVNGLVRKKYEAFIKILKAQGIDTDKLQKGYIE